MDTTAPTSTAHPLVVQHNALVNAHFDLTTTEMRMFLAMLSRIRREDTKFDYLHIPVRELLDHGSSQNYGHVRKVLKNFASRLLTVETLAAGGQRVKQRKYVVIPLLARAEYLEGEGMVMLRFNDELHDYLLELRSNFTKANLKQLAKLKSAASHRIYWLLREYASFGRRTMELAELKDTLGLTTQQSYNRFNNFRARVLEPAQQELADTDLPFTFTTLTKGRLVTHIEFAFKPAGPASSPVRTLPAPTTAWEALLREAGVSASSMPQIQFRLTAGDYDLGYVQYVVDEVSAKVKAGKIKNQGGAIFKALTDCYLLPAYQKSQSVPAAGKTSGKTSSALLARRKKLLSNLDDSRNSLAFVRTAIIYDDTTRPAAEAQVLATIAELEQQLATT